MDSQATLFEHGMEQSAVFSDCRRYRYLLSRIWDRELPLVNFLMLNPSTADETTNDPTIARQIERSQLWGYGGLLITNLFAWRSTDPSVLPDIEEPIGELNDRQILMAALRCEFTLCGWGNHGSLKGRDRHVTTILIKHAVKLKALKVNKSGAPQHPLYISYETQPQDFK